MKKNILVFLSLILMLLAASCDSAPNSSIQVAAKAKIKTITIGGNSMEPTLKNGAKVKVDVNAYASAAPQRGDIIASKGDGNSIIIKRVIALPGEKLEIRDRKIFIDGIELKEDYLYAPDSTEAPADNSLWQIPEDHVFVLSDNRTSGRDSRHFGSIAYDKIVGKVLI